MPFVRHVAPSLDRLVARVTGGRHTATSLITGLPVVTLTTTGARSGQPRQAILLGIPHEQGVVLVASNWGQARHPAWLHNLRANPCASLEVGGQPPRSYLARELQGAEREAMWQRAVALYPGYERYARRAGGRHIAVLLLSPENNVG